MNIKLELGREVYLEAFHCTPTYAGLLEGSPTKESNERLISQLSYPTDWGNSACIIKKSDRNVSENVLKPIIYCAWLSSNETINDTKNQYDGSDLVLIWFGYEQYDKSIQEIIADGVGDLDWKKYAQNFQF